MPCPEQAAAQPRLQDRVQPAKHRRRHTDSGEPPPGRAAAGYSQYEFLNALLIPGGFSFTVALADEERSEEHTSELQSLRHLVCRLLLEKIYAIMAVQNNGAAPPAVAARIPRRRHL